MCPVNRIQIMFKNRFHHQNVDVIKFSKFSSVSVLLVMLIVAGFVRRRSVGLTSGAVSLSLYCQQISKLGEALNSIPA